MQSDDLGMVNAGEKFGVTIEFSEPVISMDFVIEVAQRCRELKKEYEQKSGKNWSGDRHAYVPISFWEKVEALINYADEGGTITLLVNGSDYALGRHK